MTAPEVVEVDRVEELTVPVPGSEPAVTLRRLDVDANGGPTSLVRFPAGWSRPVTGAYEVIEEVLWLDGGFTMSGQQHPPGTYTWFPAWYERRDSSAVNGALAFAWFSGSPGWHTDGVRDPDREPVVLPWRDAPPRASPLGDGQARLLNGDAGGHATWMLDDGVPDRPAPADVQLFSVADRRFAAVTAGQALPRLTKPVYCRVVAS